MASFKKLEGFKATSETMDGTAALVISADTKNLKKLQKKGKKLAKMMKKHHKKKKHHAQKSKKAKKHKKMKNKKHHAKMKALRDATIELQKMDSGAKIVLTPKSSEDLKYLSKYTDWKAKLLMAGGCKKCAKKKYKKEKSKGMNKKMEGNAEG